MSTTKLESDWISVKDKLPKKGRLVIVGHSHDKWVCAGEYAGNGIWYNQFSEDDIIVTHWQPLPTIALKKYHYLWTLKHRNRNQTL